MTVLAFVNPKGGTGKTTACLLAAEQFARSQAKLAILDCDPNQHLVTWYESRLPAKSHTPFTVIPRPEDEQVIDVIDKLDRNYDYVFVDLEGTAAKIVSYVLTRTNLAIIPFEPTPMEARQAARAVKLITNASKMTRQDIPFCLLLTRTNAAFATRGEKDVRSKIGHLPILEGSLVRRAAYQQIFRDGKLLHELDPNEASNLVSAQQNAHSIAQSLANLLPQEEEEVA